MSHHHGSGRRRHNHDDDSDYDMSPPGSPFSPFSGFGSSSGGGWGGRNPTYDSGWQGSGHTSYSNSNGDHFNNAFDPRSGGSGRAGHHDSSSSRRRDSERPSGSSSRRRGPQPTIREGIVRDPVPSSNTARRGRGGFMTMDDLPQEDYYGRPAPQRREPSAFQGRGLHVGARVGYGAEPGSPPAAARGFGGNGGAGGAREQFSGGDAALNNLRAMFRSNSRDSPEPGYHRGGYGGGFGGSSSRGGYGGGYNGGHFHGQPSTPPGGGGFGGYGYDGYGVSPPAPFRSGRHARQTSPPPAARQHTTGQQSNFGGGETEEDLLANFANLCRGNGNGSRPPAPGRNQPYIGIARTPNPRPRHHSPHPTDHSQDYSYEDFPPYDPTAYFRTFSHPSHGPLPPFEPSIPRPQQVSTFLSQHTKPYTSTTRPRAPNTECPICYDEPSASHPCVQIKGKGNCKHIIGKSCLKAMLDLNPDNAKNCPICREEWLKEEGEWQDAGLFDEEAGY